MVRRELVLAVAAATAAGPLVAAPIEVTALAAPFVALTPALPLLCHWFCVLAQVNLMLV